MVSTRRHVFKSRRGGSVPIGLPDLDEGPRAGTPNVKLYYFAFFTQ